MFMHNATMSKANAAVREVTRFERRKASTRARIIEAAERLMRDRGVEAVNVTDITAAADIGHGTFYLHFKKKSEVLRPMIEQLSEGVHARIKRAAHGATDPGLRVAVSMRVFLRAIAEDPLWCWYLSAGRSFCDLVADLERHPTDYVHEGVASGRFDIPDTASMESFINSAVVGAINMIQDGADAERVADASAELVLRVLGVTATEASALAYEPLEFH